MCTCEYTFASLSHSLSLFLSFRMGHFVRHYGALGVSPQRMHVLVDAARGEEETELLRRALLALGVGETAVTQNYTSQIKARHANAWLRALPRDAWVPRLPRRRRFAQTLSGLSERRHLLLSGIRSGQAVVPDADEFLGDLRATASPARAYLGLVSFDSPIWARWISLSLKCHVRALGRPKSRQRKAPTLSESSTQFRTGHVGRWSEAEAESSSFQSRNTFLSSNRYIYIYI